MLRAPFLRRGDRIGIMSTARKITREELQPALDWLEDVGYEYSLGKSIGAEDHQFAGDDDLRAQDLNEMICDPLIRAIWFARGGYGSARLLEKVDWDSLKNDPKWLIGYSDITAIHATLQRKGLQSLHATMPINVPTNEPACLESLSSILTGGVKLLSWDAHELNRPGMATGKLIGGNLSVLYSLRGTACEPPYEGNILFLEDLDEYLYHIDRMLQNFDLGGITEKISGLIIGGMTEMNDNTIPFGERAEEIIHRIFRDRDIPVAYGCPSGHIDNNQALILGSDVELQVSESVILRYR